MLPEAAEHPVRHAVHEIRRQEEAEDTDIPTHVGVVVDCHAERVGKGEHGDGDDDGKEQAEIQHAADDIGDFRLAVAHLRVCELRHEQFRERVKQRRRERDNRKDHPLNDAVVGERLFRGRAGLPKPARDEQVFKRREGRARVRREGKRHGDAEQPLHDALGARSAGVVPPPVEHIERVQHEKRRDFPHHAAGDDDGAGRLESVPGRQRKRRDDGADADELLGDGHRRRLNHARDGRKIAREDGGQGKARQAQRENPEGEDGAPVANPSCADKLRAEKEGEPPRPEAQGVSIPLRTAI